MAYSIMITMIPIHMETTSTIISLKITHCPNLNRSLTVQAECSLWVNSVLLNYTESWSPASRHCLRVDYTQTLAAAALVVVTTTKMR